VHSSKDAICHFSDLIVYRRAFSLGVAIFRFPRAWPAEERCALTDQVRRSSRSFGANIAEAWAKRRYEAYFVSRLTDADAEANETEHWLACALKIGYIGISDFEAMRTRLAEIGRLLGGMMANAASFRPRSVRGTPLRANGPVGPGNDLASDR
jgi:four helix bundle protein